MSQTSESIAGSAPRPKTPIHFWVVAVLALLWNAYGCYDYVMTAMEDEAYLAAYTPEQVAYFTSFPAWYVALWALGVWSALIASVLLILRMALALPVFILSFAVIVIVFIAGLVNPAPEGVMAAVTYVITAVIWLIAIFEIWYSRLMKKRGVLR